ncbi:hypothetical protein [Marinitoga sp. 1197]|uniref:hypothetical protein n=1 Tax=Marinitoga sp. 1197 TaxID=1428449 RepID=UPI0012E04D3C|nr:hypothetical protein [Marinitoga sp. 1197]
MNDTPYPKGKIRDFAIKYGLGQKRIALGYYSFEYNERILIDEIIDKSLLQNPHEWGFC